MGRKNRNAYEARRARRTKFYREDGYADQPNETKKKHPEIEARTAKQELYLDTLRNPYIDIVFGIGPAGTGKTLLAAYVAAEMLQLEHVEHIVVVRPAVGVDGEKHGFIPGDLDEKMDPWIRPVIQQLAKTYSSGELRRLRNTKVIECVPLAFMRGLTFDNSVIILDEAQNTTLGQMKMLLTRIGENSKIFITGDLDQHDQNKEVNGLSDFLHKLSKGYSDRIAVIDFGNEDIQRHPIISEILSLYETGVGYNA